MGTPTQIDDAEVQAAVIKAETPVLVDFWAAWCGPCKMVAPVLEELMDDYTGKLDVVKVDVDKSPATASRYHIMSIPTMMLFKGGEVVDRFVGVQQKTRLQEALDQAKA